MSLQILAIVLYSHDGRTRPLNFKAGGLNIITGPPLRGKSQLIEIIDYCFGRGTPNLAPGPITQCVAWYGLHLTSESGEFFVARRAGHDGYRTSEEIYFDVAPRVVVPEFRELRATHNVDGLIEELNKIVGIKYNETPIAEASGREPFRATIRHSILLCFQAQHEIANPSVLFHRQNEDQGAIGRDLLATLPYILGTVSEENVVLQADATRVRREIRVAERRLREEELLTQDLRSRADSLYSEAVAAGIAAPLGQGVTYDQLFVAIGSLVNWVPRSSAMFPSGDEYQRALSSRASAFQALSQLRRDIDEATAYAAEHSAFVAELNEQRARLRSIGLYAHLASQNMVELTDGIREELDDVEREIQGAIPPSSDLGRYIDGLEQQRAAALAELKRADERIEALSTQVETFQQIREIDIRQAAVVGRISLFVESVRQTADSGNASRRVSELRTRLNGLEERIDAIDGSATLTEVLGQIGGLMKAWASEVGHEYQLATWRLDLKAGTVITRGPLGTVTMMRMGGGKNHLGCHLFAHMALHAWLRTNDGMTPGFILLDRPTIGFYENQPVADDPMMTKLGTADQNYVRKIFDWIEKVVNNLRGEFQVIVTEHVRLPDSELFSKAIVEDWWTSDGFLVPIDWPEKPLTQQQ